MIHDSCCDSAAPRSSFAGEPAAAADLLDALVDLLADTFPVEGGEPTWVQVLGSVTDPRLRVLPGATIPLGWLAPPACWATGLVAGGRTVPIDHPDDGQRLPVRVICLQARSGLVVSRVDFPDGSMIDEPPAAGHIVDLLRRTFRLPTDPPPVPASHLLSLAWLEAIFGQAQHATSELSWSQVGAIHPCAAAAQGSATDEAWEAALVAASQRVTWTALHDLARQLPGSQPPATAIPAAGLADPLPAEPLDGAPEPRLARWMDTGMFARWMLEEHLTIDQLRRLLPQVLDRALASRVFRVVDRLENPAPEEPPIRPVRRRPNG